MIELDRQPLLLEPAEVYNSCLRGDLYTYYEVYKLVGLRDDLFTYK